MWRSALIGLALVACSSPSASPEERCDRDLEQGKPEACRTACLSGSREGCASLARHFRERRDDPESNALGRRYDELACAAGSTIACRLLSSSYFDAGHHHAALAVDRRGCDDGDAEACDGLAFRLADGRLGACDFPAGEAAAQRACELRGDASCNWNTTCATYPGQAPALASFRAFVERTVPGKSCHLEIDAVRPVLSDEDVWAGKLLVSVNERPPTTTASLTFRSDASGETWTCDPKASIGLDHDDRAVADPCAQLSAWCR